LLLLRYYVIFEHDHQRNAQLFPLFATTSFLARSMNCRAFAKINIGLRVLGKRTDGYHDIETVFHQIDLHDELTLEPAETVRLTSTSPDVPCDSTNLCVRAAQLILKHTGRNEGVDIRLMKHIPVGAGLGGGSSDAAAVLKALNKLWNGGLQTRELESLAAQLGSDVPFFVHGGTAVGTSRGEVLDSFQLDVPYWILTATPSIHVSTAWAYSVVQPAFNTGAAPLRTLVEKKIANPEQLRPGVWNDFEEPVFGKHPEILRLKEKLEDAGSLFTQMSGSGSTVFGFFRDEAATRQLAAELKSRLTVSITPPGFKPKENS